jgi:hypothetical protein
MNDVDRRLIQDKQDQILVISKKAMQQIIDEINGLRQVLKRIAAYDTPEQLRQESENEYGLSYEEALEMAYENIQLEARAALESSAQQTVTRDLLPCPKCGGEVGHRINCPDGIAFSNPAST